MHWDFDDGTVTDRAGSTNETLVGPTYLASGGVNGSGAFSFDGSNDYIAPTQYNNIGFGDWTISFWIKTTDTAVYGGYSGTPQVSVIGDVTNAIGLTENLALMTQIPEPSSLLLLGGLVVFIAMKRK